MSDNECSYYVEFDYGNLMTDTIDDFYNKDEALNMPDIYRRKGKLMTEVEECKIF